MERRTQFLSTGRLTDYSSHTHKGEWNAFQTVHLEGSVKCSTGLLLRAIKCDDYTCECIWVVVFFPMSFKMHANLGGKADPSELPVLLIKSRAVFIFFMYLEYRSWRCFLFLFTLKLLWYLLMSSAAYLTAGFACFRCNIWQPGGTDSFNGGVSSSPVWAGGVPALTALSLIKNSITTVHSLVSESVCFAGEAKWCMLC